MMRTAPAPDQTYPLSVCLIASELLGWGGGGGFGFATRGIAAGLAGHGHRVFVVIPCPRGRRAGRFEIDGFTVIAYPRRHILNTGNIYRDIDADVYHSQEPSLASELARRAMPRRAHLVTSRDPRDLRDWVIELRYPTFSKLRLLPALAFYENPATYRSVRRADAVFVPSRCLIEKTQHKYRLARPPQFLPTPVRMPERIEKAPGPRVCFVGRLDRRKRPERFLDLARSHPHVLFEVAGASQDREYEEGLRSKYGELTNVRFLGFIDQFSGNGLTRLYSRSWIMVNTAAREGLPNSFIEAAAHGCAILSEVDPDGFASRFGEWVRDGNFGAALDRLLEADNWRLRGEAGRSHVRQTNAPEVAIAAHLGYYYALSSLDGR